MRIGVRAHDEGKMGFEELAKTMGDQGFTCTHLALYKAISDFKVDNRAMTPGLAAYIRETLSRNHIDVAVLGCYLNPGNPDPAQLKEILERYKAHIRFASWLGVGVVGTETGAPNVEYKYEEACRSEEALQTLIGTLREIVDYAEKMGVVFAIEPVRTHIIYNVERARRVLDAINSPNLQIIFDPVNLLGDDNFAEQDQVIRDAFELLGDDIAVIHGKDFVVENGKIRSVGAGLGGLHYDLLMKYVKEYKPYIQLTLENVNHDNAVDCKRYVEEKYKNA